jgi:dolichyl-phosphate beta-glucosyltransferase
MTPAMLSIVIPAYNEAARLPSTLARITACLAAQRRAAELIVVDDGSRDATAELARAAGAAVLVQPRNRGKGAAVRVGVLAAAGERILVCDADLATPIEELARLEAALDAGADLAIGSRRLARTIEVEQPWPRRILGAGFRMLVRRGFGVTVRDTMCGFKLFARPAAHDLFSHARIDRFAFDVEILYLARGRWRVTEVPVAWRHVDGSRVVLRRDVVRSVRDLVAIRLHRYPPAPRCAGLRSRSGRA